MWFEAECPVAARERQWIDDRMSWFVDQFGAAWLESPVVSLTDEFFPGAYDGTEQDIRRVVVNVCGYMDVAPEHIRVGFAAGGAGARPVITLGGSIYRNPLLLVATIARALAYERLVGEKRMTADQVDEEPADDLLTVFLGLGVITANAAPAFSHATADEAGLRATRLGRLTPPMYGYALARYAIMRGERRPRWVRSVDAGPRAYLKTSLRYLRRSS